MASVGHCHCHNILVKLNTTILVTYHYWDSCIINRNILALEMFENAGGGPGIMGLFNSQYLKPQGM